MIPISDLTSRARQLVGRLDQAKLSHEKELLRLDQLRTEKNTISRAGDLLKAVALQRRNVVASCLGGAMTSALNQIWPDSNYTAALGDDDGTGTKASVSVLVQKGEYTGEVESSYGASVKAVCSFAFWLEVLWLARQIDPALAPLVVWDEPFLNLHPRLLPAAGALLAGCRDLGIQTIIATNYEELIPEEDENVTVIRVGQQPTAPWD